MIDVFTLKYMKFKKNYSNKKMKVSLTELHNLYFCMLIYPHSLHTRTHKSSTECCKCTPFAPSQIRQHLCARMHVYCLPVPL